MEVEDLLRSANMDESRVCWICLGEFERPFPNQGECIVVDCCNCGDYEISKSLRASLFPLPDTDRYRFSFWGKQQQLEKRQPPKLSTYTIPAIVAGLPNPPVHDKPDILLRSLSLLYPEPGNLFKIDSYRQYSLAAARDDKELSFHVRTLVERGDLKQRPGPDFQITGEGWARIGRMSAGEKPNPISKAVTALAGESQIASHGQVGGITAHTVNVTSPASESPKSEWWGKWWVMAVGVATILGTLFVGLEYSDSHHRKEERAVDRPVIPVQQTKPSGPQASDSNSRIEAPAKRVVQPAKVDNPSVQERERSPVLSAPVCQETTSSNCAQNNYGQQVVIGYVAPPYRVIRPKKMSAAIATLQSAPEGTRVRINYVGVPGDKEIERFFNQVTALFTAANHWHIETAKIGKSMNFADGSTLTGEGIGCSASSNDIGTVVKKAMDRSGFPCIREAVDWGRADKGSTDVIISIGSRIVPPE